MSQAGLGSSALVLQPMPSSEVMYWTWFQRWGAPGSARTKCSRPLAWSWTRLARPLRSVLT